jgi:formimidoylglutamase
MASNLPDAVQALLFPAPPLSPGIVDEYERPAAELLRPAAEVTSTPIANLVGVPFDTSIMGRRGAKSGPEAVRWGFNASLLYEPNLGVDLSDAPRLADHGDVDVVHTNVDQTWDRVSTAIEGLVRLGQPLVTIGGDHGLTFPIIRGVCRAIEGRIGVISVDAHLDVRISHHGEKSSGVPFRYVLEELASQISGRNFIEFGIGGWLNTRVYHDWLLENGVRTVTQREIHRGDIDELIAETLDRASDGTDAIYLTFDIDAIDGAAVAATNVPAVGGLAVWQALELVWAFAQHPKAVAMDVMEVSPAWDHSTLTERIAASLVLNFAAGKHVSAAARTDEALAG